MNNEEKAKEISNDEYSEILSYNIGHSLICDNCGAIIYDRDTTDAAFRAAMKMAQWKDEQFIEFLEWIDNVYVLRRFSDGESIDFKGLVEKFKLMQK